MCLCWDVNNFFGVWEVIKLLGVHWDWVAIDLEKLYHQILLDCCNWVELIMVPACRLCHVLLKWCWLWSRSLHSIICQSVTGSQVVPLSFVASTCVSLPALWGLRICLVMAKTWQLSLAVFRCQMSCWCCLVFVAFGAIIRLFRNVWQCSAASLWISWNLTWMHCRLLLIVCLQFLSVAVMPNLVCNLANR